MNAALKQSAVPATIGTAFEGGFYGGQIRIGVAIFAIVWAPKAQGEITGKWLDRYDSVPGATSCFDSEANTKAMAEAGSEIAIKFQNLEIDGVKGWCIPARDVVEMGYRHLKPGTRQNYCSFRDGDNPSSVPAGYPYTEESPVQTTVPEFQKGGSEAFDEAWYWSSTQYSEYDAWVQRFHHGDQNYGYKSSEFSARAVRLIQLDA